MSSRRFAWPHALRWALVCAPLAGCAGPGPVGRAQPGEAQQAVVARWGAPTAEVPLPGGGMRLQYSTNPWGQTNEMVDVNAAGQVVAATQALTTPHFEQLQHGRWTEADVARDFGRPAEVSHVASWQGPIWTYRYRDSFDLMYYVYFDSAGVVRRSHPGPDTWLEVRDARGGLGMR